MVSAATQPRFRQGRIRRHVLGACILTVSALTPEWLWANGYEIDNGEIRVISAAEGNSPWTVTGDDGLGVGVDGEGTLTIGQGGVVIVEDGSNEPAIVVVAGNEGSKGRVNIGAESGAGPASGGTLQAEGLVLGLGDGGLVFNHIASGSNPLEFATDIVGGGFVLHENGHTRLTGDNSEFIGNTLLHGGTLSVSSSDSLGSDDARLIFNGGTLQITGQGLDRLDRPILWGEQGGGFDITDDADGFAVTVSADLTGNGDLVKLGEGALRLTGTNAYGNTLIQEGSLYGDAQSISGDVHIVDGTVFFEQDSDASFSGNVTSENAGAVTAAKQGSGTLALTGHSSADWWIEEGELLTSAQRFTGSAATYDGAVLTFNETGNAVYDNVIEGVGEFNKTGAGTLTLTGDSGSFLGITTVSGGILSVGGADGSGKLGGRELIVTSGGTLAGTGTVGTIAGTQVTVGQGGTLAPGNSIGTVTINGDLTFSPGSRYVVEVDPVSGASDHVHVLGRADLAGSVVHIGLAGSYGQDSRYRILTAEQGLGGAFDDVASDFAFLTPSLDYDYANFTVDLLLRRNGIGFRSLARTYNQQATAGGLESLPAGSELLQQVLRLHRDASPAVFDALSGEVHASVASALQVGSSMTRSLPLSNLRGRLAPDPVTGSFLWADVTGNWLDMDGDGNAASLRQTTHGIFVGGDHGIGAGWRLGLALGYTDSDIQIRARDSRADVESYSATLYGGKAFDAGPGQLNMLVGASYSHHRIKTRRDAAINDWNHTLKASYRGNTSQVFGEIAYAVPVGMVTVEPFAGLAWSDLRTRSFSESGGPTALAGQRQGTDVTTSTLGLRTSLDVGLGQTRGRIYGSLGWRHAFGRVAPRRTLAFDGGQPFTVAGTPLARDSALAELGVDVALSDNASIGASYQGQWGGGVQDHSARVNVQWRF